MDVSENHTDADTNSDGPESSSSLSPAEAMDGQGMNDEHADANTPDTPLVNPAKWTVSLLNPFYFCLFFNAEFVNLRDITCRELFRQPSRYHY